MKLNLFTATYPYGPGESFINNELIYLLREFDSVNVLPETKSGDIQSDFNHSAMIISYDEAYHLNYSLSSRDSLFALRICLYELFKIPNKLFYLKNFRKFFSSSRKAVKMSNWIKSLELDKNDGYYSYWMNDWAIALAILKKRKNINSFIFRVNGFDIYNERHDGNYLPFRYFVYKHTSKVVSVSKTTCDYLKKLKIYPEKITYSYFGTKDNGLIETKNHEFTIFSCSSIIPLKRVDKIAEVVSNISHRVKWIHHGDGPEYQKVLQIIKKFPENISFEKSDKKNDHSDVFAYQKAIAPDLFINLSSTEGLPVTVLEALNFGIPILLNDVGSCAELITENTGILVSADADSKNIAKIIDGLIENNPFSRNEVRNFWANNFSDEKNYSIFSSELIHLFYESRG